jgi:hypothetical protein
MSEKARGSSAQQKSRVTSANTPFMMRRTNQQMQNYSTVPGNEDKSRINELTRQVEENNQQIILQKQEIRQLKEQIIRLVDGQQIPSMN